MKKGDTTLHSAELVLFLLPIGKHSKKQGGVLFHRCDFGFICANLRSSKRRCETIYRFSQPAISRNCSSRLHGLLGCGLHDDQPLSSAKLVSAAFFPVRDGHPIYRLDNPGIPVGVSSSGECGLVARQGSPGLDNRCSLCCRNGTCTHIRGPSDVLSPNCGSTRKSAAF